MRIINDNTGGRCHLRKNRGCHRAVPSPASLTCMIITLASFLSLSARPRFFFCYPMIKSLLLALNIFNREATKGFGLRRQNLSHDTTWLGIMVIFLPLCAEGAPPPVSVSPLVPFVMRWPLFFVREMRGQAHHWEPDPPHCLPEMFWSSCTDARKQRRWPALAEEDCCGALHN